MQFFTQLSEVSNCIFSFSFLDSWLFSNSLIISGIVWTKHPLFPRVHLPGAPHPLVLTSLGSSATLLSSWDFPHHSREMHRFFPKSLIFFFLVLSLVLLKHIPLNSQQHLKLLILNQSCDYGHPWCCHLDCTITSVVTAQVWFYVPEKHWLLWFTLVTEKIMFTISVQKEQH